MATATTSSPHLSDEQLRDVLQLVQGADSVELKLTVPESQQRSTVAALELDPLDAQIRQVYFFDTPELALNEVGIVVRARRVQGKASDSVVKLRPVVPEALPEKLRKSPNLVVEVDAMPGGYVCSATFKEKLGPTQVRDTILGGKRLAKLFSKEQRAFFDRARPRRPRARPARSPRPDLRPQAEVEPTGLRPPPRGRALAVPGRLADPRALDEVLHERAGAGGRRSARVPRDEGRRPVGRAADENEDGARVLLERAVGADRLGRARSTRLDKGERVWSYDLVK